MCAKAIIDMLVEVSDIASVDRLNCQMIKLDYEPRGEQGLPGRRYFRRVKNGLHTHHIHVFQSGASDIERHIVFRDYLRAKPHRACDYCCLKARLAVQYEYDPAGYTEAKAPLIQEIQLEARRWREAVDLLSKPHNKSLGRRLKGRLARSGWLL
jgi:GrpB-like predicted nucleotidyltransferase (UPF0157 family)